MRVCVCVCERESVCVYVCVCSVCACECTSVYECEYVCVYLLVHARLYIYKYGMQMNNCGTPCMFQETPISNIQLLGSNVIYFCHF